MVNSTPPPTNRSSTVSSSTPTMVLTTRAAATLVGVFPVGSSTANAARNTHRVSWSRVRW